MSHPKEAKPDHPIHELLTKRWSPYVYSDRAVSTADLAALFEGARWAASSYNAQPWRYILGTKADPAGYEKVLSCLVEPNQGWAKAAPVIALGCTRLTFEHNDKPNAAAVHDLGLAAASLTFEATARGIQVHQMIGILPDKAREVFAIPEGFVAVTALAIGYAAAPDAVPEAMKARDLSPRTRKKLDEFVFSGGWAKGWKA